MSLWGLLMPSAPRAYNCLSMETAETEDRLLVPGEVAQRLRCSAVTVYRAIWRGELQAVRLGRNGSLRVTEEALEEFLRPARRTERSTT